MSLRVIGAGLPRTGTTSLKHAIEKLLGCDCYHMVEVFPRFEDHLPLWLGALEGNGEVFDPLFADFGAAVDWPASMFWPKLLERNPESLVLLSRRADPATWWASVDKTVWEAMRRGTGIDDWDALVIGLAQRFGVTDLNDPQAAMAAYEAHNQLARERVPPGQLVEWQPSDGWAPLCAALDVGVPDEPFPRRNQTSEFRSMAGWD